MVGSSSTSSTTSGIDEVCFYPVNADANANADADIDADAAFDCFHHASADR